MRDIEHQEKRRLSMQARLDGEKSQSERNRLGQFATPTALAIDILKYAEKIFPNDNKIRFLDPALGTGSFFSALLHVFGRNRVMTAVGYEIDDHYGNVARDLWSEFGLDVRTEDFTQILPPESDNKKATLIVCNPPYVRHHHMESSEKKRLSANIYEQQGVSLSGLSGLYCYFLCLSKEWMAPHALAAWLIPSEFMDVNYGREIKKFLLDRVQLLHIHRFSPEDCQFNDALVSSTVVWFRNDAPDEIHRVGFSFGGSLQKPLNKNTYTIDELAQEKKWSRLPAQDSNHRNNTSRFVIGDYFDVKRGIATGANQFFVLSPTDTRIRDIPKKFLTPILPSPRYLESDIIENDAEGFPLMQNWGFLFSSDLPPERIQEHYPLVWRYLESGIALGVHQRYICRNRYPWYSQDKREVASFLCTYMGRVTNNGKSKPFRFVLNHSKAIAANVYLMMYPKYWVRKLLQNNPELEYSMWQALQSIPIEYLIGEGRVYGGGLYKLEPKELLNTPTDRIASLIPDAFTPRAMQMSLF